MQRHKQNGRPNPHAKLRQVQVSVVFVYAEGTDWPTGGLYLLANSPPRSDPHDPQYAISPPQVIPESLGIDKGNRGDEVVAGGRKRRKEDQRKQELETTSTPRMCNPHPYYPGLWVKHRSKCPGILELEEDKALTRRRDWFFQLNPEPRPPTTSSFDASGENWEEGESEEDEDEDR
ncbi:hypothetical protein DFJ58DRAFT_729940 [Suillus subalutaceus]|uniref:uncharacterized protein n=1 Tax=Suillus subalutaceus TaxID=48586 RepID=UPI001B8638F4|nr:uncharacterized protein DFJ58DRAFT_729940 [Suillus subalutaceus]KAG1848342.1 hypothetical protein DFJ58DRAFT_729940 [Suillus subalutaceus]